MMMAVGFVKSYSVRGFEAGEQLVASTCMFCARRHSMSSSLFAWRTVFTHLKAEAEVLRLSCGKAQRE